MVANTTPIFPLTPHISWGKVSAANTNLDGSGTVVALFTAGAAGSRIDEIRIKHLGTNIQTALRIYVNNAGAVGTPANTSLIYEKTIAAATLDQDVEMAELVIWPDTLVLPAGYLLYGSVGTTIAAGLQITVIGGDY
jgi:hypothetical protein